jgi:hypothetical protein
MKNIELKSLLFELVFDPQKEGVSAISLVSSPAILTNFVKLKEEQPEIKIVLADEEKKIVLGPALIPNVKIFRSGRSLGLDQDAYVYFREDTIRQLAEAYLMQAKNNEVTLEHAEKTYNVKMIESWIVEDPAKDKSSLYGFELPKGTWMTAFKIQDEALWKEIKSGNINGFSIEAALGLVPKGEINLSEEDPEDDRLVLSEELRPLFLNRLGEVGTKEHTMEMLGFIKVSEDGKLTKEGEAIALAFAIQSDPAAKSALDEGLYAVRYKYEGPRDERNRDFCADVMDKDLIYRKEDIDMMSFSGDNPMSKVNYSIFRYKGSYNCRHKWVKQVYFAADWEEALEGLELYIEWLNKCGLAVSEFNNKFNNTYVTWEIQEGLQKKLDDIKKTLEDFEKQGPFGESGPQPDQRVPETKPPYNIKEPEFEPEATKVNDPVKKFSKEVQIKLVTEAMIVESAKEIALMAPDMWKLYELFGEAEKETGEDVFGKCKYYMLKFMEGTQTKLEDIMIGEVGFDVKL